MYEQVVLYLLYFKQYVEDVYESTDSKYVTIISVSELRNHKKKLIILWDYNYPKM